MNIFFKMAAMAKIISVFAMAVLSAIGTAYAQVPSLPTVSMVGVPAAAASTIVMTNDAQLGSLSECYSSIGDQPRTALQSCLEKGLREAKLQMNTAYKNLEAATKDVDSSTTPKALASLRRSQKVFESFMNAQCQWKGDSAMGGSGAGDFISSCKVDLTRWRAKQLTE